MSKVREIEKQVEAFRSALDGYQPTNNGGRPTREDQEAAKAAEVMADNIEAILRGEAR